MAEKIENVVLTLELSVADVNTILTTLADRPLKEVVSVWAKVKQSAESQLASMELEQEPAAND